MSLHYRRRLRVGPFIVNITENGARSLALKLGPFTWNLTRRRGSVNLPDGLYYRTGEQ